MPVGLQPTGISGIFTFRSEALTCPNDSGEDPGYYQPVCGQKIPGNQNNEIN
jgi:hypothetical protein